MIQRYEHNGLRVLHVIREGTTHGNLMFRVGQMDERIGQRGITHLLEHLVLFPLGLRDHHSNGETGSNVTNFHATGTSSEVTAFLRDVSASIRDLPSHRLEPEKSILRTEESQRASWSFGEVAQMRYGPRGPGVMAYGEWAIHQLNLAQVEWWRDHYLTADNAVLMIVGPELTEGLEIDLPRGEPRRVQSTEALLDRGRRWYQSSAPAAVFQTVVPRSTAATVLVELVNRLMYEELRLESGYSYTVGCGYQPIDDTSAAISGYADALDQQTPAMLGRLLELLAEVRWGQFEDADVEAIVRRRLESFDLPDFEAGRTSTEAYDLLVGAEVLTDDRYRSQLATLAPADVRALAAEAFDDLLLQVPPGSTADWAGFVSIPVWSEHRVQADWVAASKGGASALHVGSDGLSWVDPEGHEITVLYDRCVGCLAWPDGRRTLFGEDGFAVTVEPTMIEGGTEVVAAIDAALPSSLLVRLAPRDPESIPQPDPASTPAKARKGWRRRKG